MIPSLCHRQKLTALLLFVLLVTSKGCIILPIPTPAHHGFGVITEESVKSLEAEKITMADVLLKLGDPTQRLQEDRFFVYRWELTHGYLLWGVGGAGAAVGDINALTGDHFLLLEFLPNHRLRRLKFVSPRLFHRTREELEKTIDEWTESSSKTSAEE